MHDATFEGLSDASCGTVKEASARYSATCLSLGSAPASSDRSTCTKSRMRGTASLKSRACNTSFSTSKSLRQVKWVPDAVIRSLMPMYCTSSHLEAMCKHVAAMSCHSAFSVCGFAARYASKYAMQRKAPLTAMSKLSTTSTIQFAINARPSEAIT
eukprot:scaffold194_cov277-Pinguiococcus_pyrenoidosus.AAC.17